MKQFIFLISFVICQFSFGQFTIPNKPSFQTSVYDFANMLSATEKAQLEQKLINYSDSTSTQIVAITIESLNGEDIGILAPRWGQEWGIGQKGKDNGVLMLLAKNERKFWIAPGYEVEIHLPAGITGTIYRKIIRPEFKQGNFYAGFDKGADAIFAALKGKFDTDAQSGEGSILPFLVVIGLILFFVIIASKNKGGGGGNYRNGGPDLTDIIILSSLGRNGGLFGGGGSGGGGGGFSGGFGGGGFSGGGAGGDW